LDPIPFGEDDLLVVLTGAGISAESGVKTFRDNDGLWENHRIEDVATPEAFKRDPKLVLRFYDQRRKQLKEVSPNPAHLALAEVEKRLGPDRFFLVTQNVDDLHERGGSRNPVHMHGELRKIRCIRCHNLTSTEEELYPDGSETLPKCPCGGLLRPHIVWFGEVPFEMGLIQTYLSHCTHFLSIGTSGLVYPAAAFLMWARQVHAKTFGINLDPPENHNLFDQFYQGKAGEILPQWVEALQIES
jgi:NAD-dependent deacetylase